MVGATGRHLRPVGIGDYCRNFIYVMLLVKETKTLTFTHNGVVVGVTALTHLPRIKGGSQ
jgi:hypothetical protein